MIDSRESMVYQIDSHVEECMKKCLPCTTSTTSAARTTALFGHSIRNKLSSVADTLETIDTADQQAKGKRNECADKR